ncbi:class I SAM-dependent methyltransferase [Muricoccus radiodurans]|uniref:class I SAM-dependent methyltransferase n=1 Tax=Muricoccus radiodurans TaxID=2231721 RepID=UPI003CFB1831
MQDVPMQDVKDAVIAHWNRRAADFDAGPTHGLLNPAQDAAWRQVVARIAPAGRPLDALDVGCGTGFLALLLAEAGHRAAGVDLAEEMLSRARAKAAERGLDVPFHHGDAEAPPLPPASLDLIVERHVLWTLPDPLRALRSWRDLLRPGGRVALVEGAWWDMPVREEYAAVADRLPLFGGRPAAELAAPLREAGFQEPEVVPLMDAALWTKAPTHERYLILATPA